MPLLYPNDTPDAAAPLNAEALYVVYPDYPVNTDSWYGYTTLVGHAGVLLIAANGLTKYYEFGRYPPGNLGRTRNVTVPNTTIDANGKSTSSSLAAVLKKLSTSSGKNTRIRAAYFLNVDFDKMNAKAAEAPGTYDITGNNCGHYAERVVLAGNSQIDRPTIINPTPNNFVDEYIEEKNAEVLYDPGTGLITIGKGDEDDAKR